MKKKTNLSKFCFIFGSPAKVYDRFLEILGRALVKMIIITFKTNAIIKNAFESPFRFSEL